MTVIIAPQLSKALFILAIGYIRFQTFHTNNRNPLPIIISSHMPAHIMNCPFFTGKPFLKMTDNEGQHMMRRMNGRIKHSLRQFAEPYDPLEFFRFVPRYLGTPENFPHPDFPLMGINRFPPFESAAYIVKKIFLTVVIT